jgi:hypothetical protein
MGGGLVRSGAWFGVSSGTGQAVAGSRVSCVMIRSSGRDGWGPQVRQRHPHALPGGFSDHQDDPPHVVQAEPLGGGSGPAEHGGQSVGAIQRPGVWLSSS